MRAAGVRELGGSVELLELPGPRALRADEILLDVRACGVGNWDEFVRAGGWDTGAGLAAQGALTVSVGEPLALEQAAAALDEVRRGAHGAAIVLRVHDPG